MEYFRHILATRCLLHYPITPAVFIPFEEEHLVIRPQPPSPEPIPIPPHHGSPSEAIGSEPTSPLWSTSPSSYFTAAEHHSQQSSSVASTSIVGSEGALSEAEMAEVAQIHCNDIEIEEHLVTIIPG